MDLKTEDFRQWSPIRVYAQDGRIFVDWCFMGEKRFTEPFHDDTINILLREPFNLLFLRRTPIEFLGEIYERSKGCPPKGFIFHVSRCGSTLVSRMLAALRRNIVISEASVIDKIIRPDASFPPVSDEQKTIWLRWLFNALGQRRFPEEENFFVKFDSWSVLDLPLIERAFPDVPWIFMYRNPIEVIVSNLREPGAQMIPGTIENIFPGLNLFEILQFSTEERFARTIAAFCCAGLENADSKNAMLVNYEQLPDAVTNEICSHFDVSFSDEETEKMKGVSRFHAKTPHVEFKPDGEKKRLEASETVRHFAQTLVEPLYEELEKRRLKIQV
jgi:hypothetical protein